MERERGNQGLWCQTVVLIELITPTTVPNDCLHAERQSWPVRQQKPWVSLLITYDISMFHHLKAKAAIKISDNKHPADDFRTSFDADVSPETYWSWVESCFDRKELQIQCSWFIQIDNYQHHLFFFVVCFLSKLVAVVLQIIICIAILIPYIIIIIL